MQSPICTDDYGDSVFIGYWSDVLVWPKDAVLLGAVIPQVREAFVDHKIHGVIARKISIQAFHESEGNCNACKYFRRHTYYERKKGDAPIDFVFGTCASQSPNIEAHPYKHRFHAYGMMILSPVDWMGMPCWESRVSTSIPAYAKRDARSPS